MTLTEPTDAAAYVHDDGRVCEMRRYWVGTVNVGEWRLGRWFFEDGWRWCGRPHP